MNVKDLPTGKGIYHYLATPYSKWPHGLEDANVVAQRLAARVLMTRVVVFCPIAHTHGISKFVEGVDQRDFDFWLGADEPMVTQAASLVIANLTGWRESRGVQQEITWAKEQKKPIWLLNVKTLDVTKPRL